MFSIFRKQKTPLDNEKKNAQIDLIAKSIVDSAKSKAEMTLGHVKYMKSRQINPMPNHLPDNESVSVLAIEFWVQQLYFVSQVLRSNSNENNDKDWGSFAYPVFTKIFERSKSYLNDLFGTNEKDNWIDPIVKEKLDVIMNLPLVDAENMKIDDTSAIGLTLKNAHECLNYKADALDAHGLILNALRDFDRRSEVYNRIFTTMRERIN